MFDTLAYANKLKEVGFTEAQAEALILVLNENLANKQDIESVRRDIKELELATNRDIELLRRDMKEMETSLKHDIELVKKDVKELEVSLKHDIKELELKFEGKFTLLNWMLGVTFAGVLSLVLKTFFV